MKGTILLNEALPQGNHPSLYKYSLLFKNLVFDSSLLWKTYINTCFSLTDRNLKKIFSFTKKKKKEAKCKNQIQHFFGPIMETAAPKAAKVASPSSFPENHTQHLSISHQAATALNCVKDKVASLLNLNVFCVFIS